MAKTTDELFAEATEADYETAEPVTLAASDTEEEFQFRIDEHLRTIAIPEKGVVAGVEGDLNVNIARFTMTRYYHGRDLSKLNIRINYRNANGQVNYYTVSDATVSGDSIVFSWEFAADVTQYKGNVQFVVYLFSATNAVLKQRFFTTLGTLEVLEGLEVDSSIPVSEQTDILLHLKKDLSAYAEEVKKSLPADYTAMTEQVNSLKEDLSVVKNSIFDISATEEIFEEVIHSEFTSGRVSAKAKLNIGDDVVFETSSTWNYVEFVSESGKLYEVKFRATSNYSRYIVAVDSANKITNFVTTIENVIDETENIIRFYSPNGATKIYVSSYGLSDENFYAKSVDVIHLSKLDTITETLTDHAEKIGLPKTYSKSMTIQAYGLNEIRNVLYEGDIKEGQRVVIKFAEPYFVKNDRITVSKDGTKDTLIHVVVFDGGETSVEFTTEYDIKLIKIYSSIRTENANITIDVYPQNSIEDNITKNRSDITKNRSDITETIKRVNELADKIEKLDTITETLTDHAEKIGLPKTYSKSMTIQAYGLNEIRNVLYEGDIKEGQRVVIKFAEPYFVKNDRITVSKDGTKDTLIHVVVFDGGETSVEFTTEYDIKLIKIYSSIRTENANITIDVYPQNSIEDNITKNRSDITKNRSDITETIKRVNELADKIETLTPVRSLFLGEFNTEPIDTMKADCLYTVFGEKTFFTYNKGKIGGKVKKNDKFRFCIVSDIHINECPEELRPDYKDGAWERYYYNSATNSCDYSVIENSLKFVDDKTDLIISLGDTIDRGYGGAIQEAQLIKLNDILSKSLKDTPFLSHRGNHDQKVDRFNDIGRISFCGVNIYFILADYDSLPIPEGSAVSYRSTGIVPMERIEALDKLLTGHEDECNIVCCHYALGTDNRRNDWWIRDEYVNASGVARNGNRSSLISVLTKHRVKIFLNGHEHNAGYPVYTLDEDTSIKNVNCGSLFNSFAIATVDKSSKTVTIEVYSSVTLERKTDVGTIVLPYA